MSRNVKPCTPPVDIGWIDRQRNGWTGEEKRERTIITDKVNECGGGHDDGDGDDKNVDNPR